MDYYKSALHKIRTALALSPGDWAIFIQAWARLLAVDLLLRSRPFPRVQEWVSNRYNARQAKTSGETWEIIQRNQRLVLLAARYSLYRMECLRQALALQVLLGKKGIPTELRFGARKTADQFLAHAWLEYEGKSIELTHTSEAFIPLRSREQHR